MYTDIGDQKCNVLIRNSGDVARHKLGVFSWIKNDLKELGKKNGCNYKCYANITLGVIRVYNTNIKYYNSEIFEYDMKRFFNNHTKYPVEKNDIVPGEDKGYINVEYILEFSNDSNNVIVEVDKDG